MGFSTFPKSEFLTYHRCQTFNGTKNLIFFAIGFAVVPWVEQNGPITVFCILAAIVFVIDCGAVFLYVFGKRLRARDGRLKIFPF